MPLSTCGLIKSKDELEECAIVWIRTTPNDCAGSLLEALVHVLVETSIWKTQRTLKDKEKREREMRPKQLLESRGGKCEEIDPDRVSGSSGLLCMRSIFLPEMLPEYEPSPRTDASISFFCALYLRRQTQEQGTYKEKVRKDIGDSNHIHLTQPNTRKASHLTSTSSSLHHDFTTSYPTAGNTNSGLSSSTDMRTK